jgi:hypothetical protein
VVHSFWRSAGSLTYDDCYPSAPEFGVGTFLGRRSFRAKGANGVFLSSAETSEVSHAHRAGELIFRDDKARPGRRRLGEGGSNGDAPSRIAGPIRALAVVTG